MKKRNLKNYKLDETAKGGLRYVGTYYATGMLQRERKKSGIYCMAAGLLDILLIFICIGMNCMGTRTVYVIIPMECILFCAMYYVMGAYAFYRSEDRMEQKTFDKAIDNPIQIMTIAIVLNGISVMGQILLLIRKFSLLTGYRDYLLLLLLIAILILHVILWRYQKKLHAITKPVK